MRFYERFLGLMYQSLSFSVRWICYKPARQQNKCPISTLLNEGNTYLFRDWSKSIGWGGPEKRGSGSSVFESLVRGLGRAIFSYPWAWVILFFRGIGTLLSANLQVKFH